MRGWYEILEKLGWGWTYIKEIILSLFLLKIHFILICISSMVRFGTSRNVQANGGIYYRGGWTMVMLDFDKPTSNIVFSFEICIFHFLSTTPIESQLFKIKCIKEEKNCQWRVKIKKTKKLESIVPNYEINCVKLD